MQTAGVMRRDSAAITRRRGAGNRDFSISVIDRILLPGAGVRTTSD